jgi:outer membrane protein assembly factor BamB
MKIIAAIIIALIAGIALIKGAAFAQNSPQDYPQWRGPNRDGGAGDFSAPKSWPEKLTRKWKVAVGEGYATPIVIGETVYAFTRSGGDEVMAAFNISDGKLRWRTPYPAPYSVSDATAAHGAGPKATPLFYQGKLFTLGVSGIVSAFDAAGGKLLWQKPAPKEHPYFGTAVSPLGADGMVILHPGNYGPLTAFDANTGAVKWTAEGESTWASPVVVELEGVRQVVTMTGRSVIGVSVSEGAPLWQFPWKPARTPSAITPLQCGDMVIVASQGNPVAALKPSRRNGKWTVDVVWEAKEISLFLSNPVIVRDTLFGLSERSGGQFFALDAKTGKTLWLGQRREATNTAVVKAGDLLFLLNDDAELIVAKGDRESFKALARYKVADSATWAQPALTGNRIFIKDVSTLALWTLK